MLWINNADVKVDEHSPASVGYNYYINGENMKIRFQKMCHYVLHERRV